jgi:hypothetical protein
MVFKHLGCYNDRQPLWQTGPTRQCSIGRTVGLILLRGDPSDEPMASFLDVSEQLGKGLWKSWFSFSTGWTAGLKRESVGSSDGRKISTRDELSAQTPSPDEPMPEPTRQRFIRWWHFWCAELYLIFDPINVTYKPTQTHSSINSEWQPYPQALLCKILIDTQLAP